MLLVRQFLARLGSTLSPRQRDRDVTREIDAHLALIEEGLRLQGLSPGEAALEARRRFGGVSQTKELHQDARSFRTLHSVGRDLRHAVRSLGRRRLSAALIVVALALGIGLNGAMFSVARALLLTPLRYEQSDRLVWIWSFDRKSQVRQWASFPDFQDWQARSHTVESFVGWGSIEPTLVGVDEPERLQAVTYTGDLFGLLGAAAQAGALPGNQLTSPTAVISDSLWRRQFGADDRIVGAAVTLSGQSYTVAAVMPPQFRFPPRGDPVDVWIPLPRFNPALARRRDARLIEVIARRNREARLQDVQAEFDVIARNLASEYPASNDGIDVRIVSGVEEVSRGLSRPLTILGAAVACLLLLACVNIVNLLVIGGVRRRQEIAIRHALGAGRHRVASMLSAETLLLCVIGGALAAVVATAVLSVTSRWLPPDMATTRAIDFDRVAYGVLAAIAIGVAAVVGLIPAWTSSRVDLSRILQQGAPTTSASRRTSAAIRLLLVAQISLATMLALEAGLFLNSYFRLSTPLTALDAEHVLTFDVSWPSPQFKPAGAAEAFAQLQRRLLETPGIEGASAGVQLPDRGRPLLDDVLPFAENPDRPPAPNERQRTGVLTIQPGFFGTMRIAVIGGREFTAQDHAAAAPVGIVNASLAAAYFPGGSAVGRRLVLDAWTFGRRELEIVAVVADVTHGDGARPAHPLVYLPLAQYPKNTSSFVVRTNGESMPWVPNIRAAAASVAANVPLHGIDTLKHRIDTGLAQDRLSTVLLASFSFLALALAASGVYGVVAYGAAHRRHEIAIRHALGANARSIWMLVTTEALFLMAIGLGIGLGGAFTLARVMSSSLYGVSPTDPLTYGVTCLAVALVALAACARPALRAASSRSGLGRIAAE